MKAALPRADSVDKAIRLMDYCSRKGKRYDVLVRTTALCVAHRHGAAEVVMIERDATSRRASSRA